MNGAAADLPPAQPRKLELIEQYRILHLRQQGYGASSERQCGFIQVALDGLGPIRSILDYGCGRSRLVDWLGRINGAAAFRYDPAIAEFATAPAGPFDLVVNTDVLEHVDARDLDGVLAHVAALSPHAYFNIATDPAATVLPNGENAHCTVRPAAWWRDALAVHFPVVRPVAAWKPQRCSFVTWAA